MVEESAQNYHEPKSADKGPDVGIKRETQFNTEIFKQAALTLYNGIYKKETWAGGSRGRAVFAESIYAQIADYTGSSKEWAKGKITPNMQQGVDIFLNALLEFIENLRKQKVDKKEILDFTSTVHELLFSMSPSIVNYATFAERLSFAARTTRYTELQGFVGPSMIGELTYDLAYSSEGVENIFLTKIQSQTPATQIDILHTLEAVATNAAANGQWAKSAELKIENLINLLANSTPYPLVRFATDVAAARLTLESEDPSGSIVHFSGDQTNGRSSRERINAEFENRLLRNLRLDQKLESNEHLVSVSSDIAGIADQSGRVVSFFEKPNADHEVYDGPASEALTKLSEAISSYLASNTALNERAWGQIFAYLEANILPYLKNINSLEWYQKLGFLNNKEWKEFFESEKLILEKKLILNNKRAQLNESAGDKNEKASSDFVLKIVDLAKQAKNHDHGILKNFSEEFAEATAKNDAEWQYNLATNLARALTTDYANLTTDPDYYRADLITKDVGKKIKNALETVLNSHQMVWKKVEKEMVKEETQILKQLKPAFAKRQEIIKKIMKFQDGILTAIKDAIDPLLKEAEKKLPLVKVIPGEEFISNPTILPYSSEKPEDEELVLLQQLHRPELKRRVEQSVGIKLEELSLRGQLHLLRFLAEQKSEPYKGIEQVAAKDGLNKIAFLESFFACAENHLLGEKLVAFARDNEPEKVNAVCERYKNFVAQIENTEQLINKFYQTQDKKTLDTRDAVREILKRGNALLAKYIEQGKTLSLVELESELQKLENDVLIFASLFKVASRESSYLDFNEVKDVSLTGRESGELNAEEKEEMLAVFEENRSDYPKDLRTQTIRDFKEILDSKGKQFFFLRHKDKIVAFIRFDALDDDTLYAGSLNVRTEMRGSAIGSAFFKATLDKAAEHHTVKADVYERNPMLKHYIADFGFKAVGEDTNYHNSGQRFIKIERAPTKQTRLLAQAA